jgi:hypothetical protein
MLFNIRSILLFSLAILYAGCGGGDGRTVGPTGAEKGIAEVGTYPPETDYVFSRPVYITDSFAPTTRKLELGVTVMDWWGNSYNELHTKYEPSKEFVSPMLKRLNQIGSKFVMITDFHVLYSDKSMHEQPNEGAMTMTQEELNNFVSKARANGQKSVFLWNGLYGKSKDLHQYIDNLHSSPVQADIDLLLDNWKAIIEKQAKKAEIAGFDGMIVDPRDMYFFFDVPTNKTKWQAIIDTAKTHYSGKILFWSGRGGLINFANNLTGIDGFIIDEQVQDIISSVTNESITSLKTLWKNWLTEASMVSDLCAKGDVYVSLLMSSYNGAIQNGWVEPWGEYPDGTYQKDFKEQAVVYEALLQALYDLPALPVKGFMSYGYWWSNSMWPDHFWQRSDISHSIRIKDAEHVFYRWTKIFNQ